MLKNIKLPIAILIALFSITSVYAEKKEIVLCGTPETTLPLSKAIEYDGIIFVSGQIGSDLYTLQIVEGIEAQTKQVLDNISTILQSVNSGMDKVLKVNIFVKNLNDYHTVNKIYATYFNKPYPVRTFIEVSRLPMDVLIEIEVIAHK